MIDLRSDTVTRPTPEMRRAVADAVVNDAAVAQLSGVVAHTVAGDHGVMTVDQLRPLLRPENDHIVHTRLVTHLDVCLESIQKACDRIREVAALASPMASVL